MQWEVSGADRQTGEDRKIIIEADNEDSARRRGNRAGLFVSDVRAIDPNDSMVMASTAIVAQTVRATPTPPPPSKTRCPKCNSDDTASLRTIYEHGTGSTTGSLIGMGSGGGLDIGNFSAKTMSHAAARAAPPPQKNDTTPLVCCVLCAVGAGIAFLVALANRDSDTLGGAVCFGVVLAGIAVAAGFIYKGNAAFNRNQWPILHSRWSAIWMCRRCSEMFAPGQSTQFPVVVSTQYATQARAPTIDAQKQELISLHSKVKSLNMPDDNNTQ